MNKITATRPESFDTYMQTGDVKCLNDISLANVKVGDEFVIAGEGWNWTVKVTQ